MKHKNFFRGMAVAVTLALLLVAIPASPVLAAISIDVDPEEGEIGEEIEVTGTGFPQSEEVYIFFSRQQADTSDQIDDEVTVYRFVGSQYTNAITGSLFYSFDVPQVLDSGLDPAEDEDVYGGMHYIYITYTTTKTIRAVASFRVVGIAEVTEFDPEEGTVGTEVEISGEGLAPGEAIAVEYDGDEIEIDSGDDEADEDGEFTLFIIIPESTYGEHTVTVKGEDSLSELELTFFVIPEIMIDPEEGEAGINVTIIGNGFDRYNDVIIYFDGDEVKTKRTGSDGTFDTFLTVPEVDEGTYTVVAEDEDDDDIWADAEFTVIVVIPPLNPAITVGPTSDNVGEEVEVSGEEFGTELAVTIYFDGVSVTTSPAAILTTEGGIFSGTFLIPASTGGSHTIKAQDTEGNSATASLIVEPEITTIEPEQGPPGTEVTVNGTGFGYRSDIVTIDFDGDDLEIESGDDRSGTDGSFEFSFIAPVVGAGTYDLEVEDEDGNKAEAEFTIVVPEATISPTTGVIGTEVAVSGSGFLAGRQILVTYNGVLVPTDPSPIFAKPDGSFSSSFNTLANPAGTYVVTVSDGTNIVSANFVTTAEATIIPTSGIVGSGVGVGGIGFGANKTITILFNNTSVTPVDPIATGPEGSFSGGFYVPASPAGAATITITDGTNSVNTSFVVESDITISQTTSATSPGYVGMELTISGTGYKANADITVTYASDPVVFTGKTDSSGSFDVDFRIPESAGGEHTITVSIDDVQVKQYTFIMESTPPAAPQQLLIYLGARAEQPVYLHWAEVTDLSLPVQYNLEIATDGNFSNVVLEETGLTELEYTVPEAKKLEPVSKKEPYYWRVQAVDSAGNVSDWSDADSFYISGGWPGWLMWLWIGLGALFVIILGFLLGRRSAYAAF